MFVVKMSHYTVFVLVVENQVDGFVLDKCQTNVRKFFSLVRALAVSFVGKTNEV